MRFWLTIAILGALLLLAKRSGGAPEKAVAAALSIAFACGLAAQMMRGPSSFLRFDPMLFIWDLATLVAIIWVAIRADRWWPLCASALQSIIVSVHILKLLGLKGMVGIFWALTTLPSYLICLVLLGGIRSHARRVARYGHCRDWRSS